MISPDEVDKIAEMLIEKIQARKHAFWIDPEQHYLDHKRDRETLISYDEVAELRQIVEMFRMARGLFFRAFLGLAIIGAVMLAGIGLFKDFIK